MVKCNGGHDCKTLAKYWIQLDGKRYNVCQGCLNKLEGRGREVKILDDHPYFDSSIEGDING